jgi:hypothetical protein
MNDADRAAYRAALERKAAQMRRSRDELDEKLQRIDKEIGHLYDLIDNI